MENKNVNSEAKSNSSHQKTSCGLCHVGTIFQTEEWSSGLNKIPQKSISELRNHPISKNIITRALLLLLNQLGSKTVPEFPNCTGNHSSEIPESINNDQNDENTKNQEKTPLSPLSKEEFQNIMKNGWPRKSQSPVSPLSKEEFRKLLKNGLPLESPTDLLLNASDSSCSISPTNLETIGENQTEKKKILTTPLAKNSTNRALFTVSTPLAPSTEPQTLKLKASISDVIITTPGMSTLKAQTSIRRHSIQRMTPYPLNGEGPLENKASRLRRQRGEEQRMNSVKKDRKNISIETLNSTFSSLSLKFK